MTIVPATAEAIAHAASAIRGGHLVGLPTETVYGLAADATNGGAVAQVFALKGRPRFNPLIVHVANFEAAARLVHATALAEVAAAAFWPGPLTLVLRARGGNAIADLVSAGLETLAVRVPAHPVARELLEACGRPLAAPSANRSGHVSPTTAAHVAAEFGSRLETILDGGPCVHGLESTILDVSGETPWLLRPGSISLGKLEAAMGRGIGVRAPDPARPSAPGQLESHYAPNARVRLNVRNVEPGEALLAFGPEAPATDGPMVNLSESRDVVEAAQRLFAALRTLDASGARTIAVMPIPQEGLGEAINDRLERAAAPRPRSGGV